MGSGIVCNGQILEGTNGFAVEIGHMRLTDDDPIGYKKSGSFEGWYSGETSPPRKLCRIEGIQLQVKSK